jgi:transposase
MTYLSLTSWQRRRLCEQLHQTTDARVYRRTLAILEFDRGRGVTDIAQLLHTSRQSIYRWLEAYAATPQPAALADAQRGGQPVLLGRERQDLLRSLLALPPQELGLPHTVWSAPLLRETLEALAGQRVSSRTIRRALGRLDYTWKRPRYVLDADPELEKKTSSAPPDRRLATAQRGAGRG